MKYTIFTEAHDVRYVTSLKSKVKVRFQTFVNLGKL